MSHDKKHSDDRAASNAEVESQLDSLAEICCEALQGEQSVINDRSEALLKSLLMSGYARQPRTSLQAELESRAKEKCRDRAMHRGGALSGISKQLQEKFDELVRWESKQPAQQSTPKSANISSATDA